MSQGCGHGGDDAAVLGEDRTRQGVGTGGIALVQRVLEAAVGVYLDSEDGSEDLFAHQLGFGVLGHHDGGLDEVALPLVALATGESLEPVGGLGELDV